MEVIVRSHWEYCAIVSISIGYDGWLIGNTKHDPSSSNYQPTIQYFSEINYRQKIVGDDPNPLSNEISKLGMNGWELVSVDQGIMYFKRQK